MGSPVYGLKFSKINTCIYRDSLLNYSSKRKASLTWRGILKTRDILVKGRKWCIGNGSNVSIWYDWWCGECSLASLFPISHLISSEKVDTLLDEEGRWDVGVISVKLPREAWDLVLKVQLPRFVTYPDMPHWKGSRCGAFTTASAFELVTDKGVDSGNWLWLWKLKIPQILKGFVLLALHQKLLTNSLRVTRGMSNSALCNNCGDQHSIYIIHRYATDIKDAFNISIVNSLDDELTSWSLPLPGKLKMNTDGSSKGDPGNGGFGGLIRDEKGIWLCGYFGYFPIKKSSGGFQVSHLRYGFSIQHVKREGNKSADGLAKMGANQNEMLVVMDDPPKEIRGQLVADMVGQSYLRPCSGGS
ncbi:uncharacterized protein LOC114296042 [Camellia sinensis]|uniref:uncharacterized protein LOC114296042 n=1 Tax=Camellia sinensis TaxID=4442 RepID=UPI0010366CFF|nr:uncharacterized protein LOC114296042 [Camellia sinensis]